MSGTNDPDGKIARETAERRAQEKKATEEKAGSHSGYLYHAATSFSLSSQKMQSHFR